MTLWPIHDETAGILVASIYELWQNGASGTKPTLAEAVRAAQCRLMQENPHPIFWAPFILVGRP
jgi:CHAT domain-containing protein